MKLAMTERSKHRLIGLFVVIAIMVIFLPTIMKKSNQRFEENNAISLKLPAKPAMPRVAIPNQRVMFKSVKVAHVKIPTVKSIRTTSMIAKAESLHTKPVVAGPSNIVSIPTQTAQVAQAKKIPVAVKPVQVAQFNKPKVAPKANDDVSQAFAIQVATFTQQPNADALVARLKDNGFAASYRTIKGTQGPLYQVVVGQLVQREKAVDLQKKLATNMQLNGLIVKATGVS